MVNKAKETTSQTGLMQQNLSQMMTLILSTSMMMCFKPWTTTKKTQLTRVKMRTKSLDQRRRKKNKLKKKRWTLKILKLSSSKEVNQMKIGSLDNTKNFVFLSL